MKGKGKEGLLFLTRENLVGDINVAASFLLLSGNSITMTFTLRACNVHAHIRIYIMPPARYVTGNIFRYINVPLQLRNARVWTGRIYLMT